MNYWSTENNAKNYQTTMDSDLDDLQKLVDNADIRKFCIPSNYYMHEMHS